MPVPASSMAIDPKKAPPGPRFFLTDIMTDRSFASKIRPLILTITRKIPQADSTTWLSSTEGQLSSGGRDHEHARSHDGSHGGSHERLTSPHLRGKRRDSYRV